ncbi:DUF6843 domain-containing protein [Paenibacillus sp. NPDC056579]|uniref:DUF6843 domain-containing protein n=1 Tax=unclassified Paenibacillus TaxID=185978 RepID=UPI001EF7767F|nr:hypothetical protein [Paenibacillus sp. H1-7]ULL16027.1 hypothetical protein DVH26_17185 [Paenibacillus sp. H1-7]
MSKYLKLLLWSFLAVFVIITVGLIVVGIMSVNTSATNDIYLIPEGFEGKIQVTYNVQGAPLLAKEGKYDVIPIRSDGTYDTSKPDMEYGTVTDQYYYVTADGRRTAIDTSCVYVGGNGATESGGVTIRYNYLKITRTKCGEHFRAWGE